MNASQSPAVVASVQPAVRAAPSLAQRCAAEALGTFGIVLAATLANAVGALSGQPGIADLTAVALVNGLIVACMIAMLHGICGAHFNPAVTLALLVLRRIDARAALAYVGAQLVGAAAASALLLALLGSAVAASGIERVVSTLSPLQAFGLEALFSFILVSVIIGSAVDPRAPRGVFPLAIGFAVLLLIVCGGPLTGAAMNPARAFGPALVCGHWEAQWLYWAGPLSGGALAAGLWRWLLPRQPAQ